MSLNFDVPAASLACSPEAFEQVQKSFDAFNRSDVRGEIIVDTGGWDPEEEPLQMLAGIVGEDESELMNLYLVLYVE